MPTQRNRARNSAGALVRRFRTVSQVFSIVSSTLKCCSSSRSRNAPTRSGVIGEHATQAGRFQLADLRLEVLVAALGGGHGFGERPVHGAAQEVRQTLLAIGPRLRHADALPLDRGEELRIGKAYAEDE